MNSQPFLSIVIPTRDRPQLLRHALWSALHQSDPDFEVIVCDNPNLAPARSTFDEVVGGHPNFHYIRPETDLNMVDNWNFAVSHTKGEYVTILEDKFALHLDCVEALKQVAKDESPEIISWYPDVFWPDNEEEGCNEGKFLEMQTKNLSPCSFDPQSILKKRLTHSVTRGEEGNMYGIGKILFGTYHRKLIKRIASHTGQLFHPFAPDYTSMTAALLLANSAVDIGRSLCVAVSTSLSNGTLCQRNVEHAEKFYATYGELEEIINQLPLRKLTTPNHNTVAHDYLLLCQLLPKQSQKLKLNWTGLYLQCEKELGLVNWKDEKEKNDHYHLLQISSRHFPLKHRIALALKKVIPLAPKTFRPILENQFKKIAFRLEGKSTIRPDSNLWQRWTTNIAYIRLQPPNLGLNSSLLYLYLRRHIISNKKTISTQTSLMNSGKLDKPELKNAQQKKASQHGSAAYWTERMVVDENFPDADASLAYFEWRNAQYPGYIELMPVSGQDGKIIVDYGCGPGNDLVGFGVNSNPENLIGIDVSKTALTASDKRLSLHNIPVELIHIEEGNNSIPLDSNSVDLVHSSGVLHHCKNLDSVLTELHRILKPGGTMQIMVYNYDSLWLHLYTAYIHQIEKNLYCGDAILEAFKQTTDGPHCPISNCYKPDDFLSIVQGFGFIGKFIGASISLTEMKLLPKRFDAIANQKLAKEHRDFLSTLTFDSRGIPLTRNKVAGIGACYNFKKQ